MILKTSIVMTLETALITIVLGVITFVIGNFIWHYIKPKKSN